MKQRQSAQFSGASVPKGSACDGNLQERVQKELSATRSAQQRDLNRTITICWGVIVLTFMISYLFEMIKGLRDISYMLCFWATMIVPLLICWLRYRSQPDDSHYGVWVICGYFVMYTFALLTGNTTMVFSYILPMLCFMVLLHSPRLVLGAGAAALAVNMISVYRRYAANEITIANSQDTEIQLALIIFCFAGAWLSSKMYDRITRSNEEALEHALQQESTIHGLENVVLVDKLTGLGNRAAYDFAISEIIRSGSQVGVIFCDANGLKYRNDHMGHLAGDQLLKDVADKLRTHFQPSCCYRISGDEFMVLIPGLEQEVFSVRAERFHQDIWSEKEPIVGVGWDHSTSDVNEAVKNAEIRMYADKAKFYELFPQYKRN